MLLALLPKNRLDSAFKGLVSVIVIFSVISPLKNSNSWLELGNVIKSEEEYEEVIIDKNTAVIDCAEKLLEEQLDFLLAQTGSSIYSEAHILCVDEGAVVERVEIYGAADEAQRKQAASVIKEKLGGDIVIEFR